MSELFRDPVQIFYIAYFGRAVDPGGLQFYSSELALTGVDPGLGAINDAYDTNPRVRELIDGFGGSQESRELFASTSTEGFVNSIYRFLFNRDADLGGLQFWSGEITAGRVSEAKAALAIAVGAFSNRPDQGTQDSQLILKKIQISNSFTSNLDSASEQNAYSGQAAAQKVRDLISEVTINTDAAAFDARIQQVINDLVSSNSSGQGGSASGQVADLIVDGTFALSAISKFGNDGSRINTHTLTADVTPTLEFQAAQSGLSFRVDWGNGAVSTGTTTGALQRVTLGSQYFGVQSHQVQLSVTNGPGIETQSLELSVAQPTSSTYVNGLIVGTKIENPTQNGATPVYYLFYTEPGRSDLGFTFTESEKVAFRSAMNSYAEVANLVFIETNDINKADFKFALANETFFGGTASQPTGILGQMTFPSFGSFDARFEGQDGFGAFNINMPNWGDFSPGSLPYAVLVHEIGHGLGLAHPHDSGGVSSIFPETLRRLGFNTNFDNAVLALNGRDNDNPLASVMSYDYSPGEGASFLRNFSGNATGPGSLDVAALEYLYGVHAARTGNDTYIISDEISQTNRAELRAIHDTGGVDTLVYQGSSSSLIILYPADLNDRSLSLAGGIATSFRTDGQFGDSLTFSHRTIIENVISGNSADLIIDNLANNNISSGGGDDILAVTGGNDTVDGGAGFDLLSFEYYKAGVSLNASTGQAFSSVGSVAFSNIEYFGGSEFSDRLIGSFRDELFVGSAGSDVIDGGGGFDIFTALGASAGVFFVSETDKITVGSRNNVLGEKTELRNIDRLIGSDFADAFGFGQSSLPSISSADGFYDFGNGGDYAYPYEDNVFFDAKSLSDTLRNLDSVDLGFSSNANMLIRATDIDLMVQERGFWSRSLGLGNSSNQEFFILGGTDDTVRLFDEWSQIDTRFFNGDSFRILASQLGNEVIIVGIDTDIAIQFVA